MSASTGKVEKLRFALMIEGEAVPTWATDILGHLSKSKEIEAVACIYLTTNPVFEVSSIHEIALSGSQVNLTKQTLELAPAEPWERRIESLDIDFVLSLTSQTPPDSWLSATLYGFWRYRFGDTTDYKSIGVTEVLKNIRWQKVDLEKIQVASSQSRQVLMSGFFKFHKQSLGFHREATLHQCAKWPTEISRQILQFGGLNYTQSPALKEPKHNALAKSIAKATSFIHQIKFQFDRIRRQFIYQQWNIGTIPRSIDKVFHEGELDNVVWWPAPKAPMCLADPFPVIINGKLHVLAEQFSYIDHHGAIVAFEADSRGLPVHVKDAIRLPVHISYPCMIQDNGQTYAAFEMLDVGELVIFKCERFPDKWVRHSVVTDGHPYADPTIFKKDGRWWVFATRFNKFSEGNTSLYAWYSEGGLEGPWKPHARNPIKLDIRSSRSAGSVFSRENKLYRPAQNCLHQYGRSIVINEVRVLDPLRFSEVIVEEIHPKGKFRDGIHHIAGAGDWTLVDGRRDRFSLLTGFKKLRYHLQLRKPKVVPRLESEWGKNSSVTHEPAIPKTNARSPDLAL